MASKSQTYFNNISSDKNNTISLVVSACKEKGITNPIIQSAMCGIVSKESDFVPKGEGSYSTTSVSRIRSIFGSRIKSYTDAELEVLKKDDKKFFSVVYGDTYGNGPEPTGDGWTYRGRGFNQLTFGGNYDSIGKKIGKDLKKQPELVEKLDVAAKALVQFYIDSFNSIKSSLLSRYGVTKSGDAVSTLNSINDIATGVRVLYQATAGSGKTEGGMPVGLYFDQGNYFGGDGDLIFPKDNLGGFTKARNRAPLFYKLITGQTPPNTNDPTQPVIPPGSESPVSVTASNTTNNNSNDPVSQDQTKGDGNDGAPIVVDQITPGLSNVFPPTLKVEPIKFEHKNFTNTELLKEWSSTVGTKPFIWYNSYQIDDGDIDYFALYHDGLLPTITITFKDSQNLMKNKGFPLDDSRIKIFISSRTLNIRHILLEFKIKNFSINDDKATIIGTLNVNGLHTRKFKSSGKKTSFFAIQDVCKRCEIGFNSNISDSKDTMSWINTGSTDYDFIDEILLHSYISDSAFPYGYVDFFYNFNYVDIEKELTRDISDDKGVDSSGLASSITGDDRRINVITLGNDRSFEETDSYISEYKILNNSTSISLERGYLNISKFYDSVKKEYLIFDVDSITSEGSKTIIMKGSPQDEGFYKDNINTEYVGKMDGDNVHVNYNYSYTHNLQNIMDLQKIGAKLKLPNPNYNLYRFQKVNVLLTNLGTSPSGSIKNDRLSGDWFIVDIKFIQSDGIYYQELSLIKRELGVSNDEFESGQSVSDNTNNNSISKNNASEKTTNPTDLTNTDAPNISV